MAWALVAHAVSGNADGQGPTYKAPHATTVDTTGANLYVVFVSYYGGSPVSTSLADTSLNTYTLLSPQVAADGNTAIATYYVVAPTTSAVNVWVLTSGGGHNIPYAGITALAVSGCGATPTVTHTQSGTTTQTPAAGSLGASGNLVATGVSDYAATVSSIDSSFAITDQSNYTGSNNIGIAAAWQNLSAGVAGAVNPTWTLSASPSASAVQAISFTGVGGGATSGLFMQTPMNGLGVGGPFFPNPLGAPVCQMPRAPRGFARRSSIYVPERMAA